MLPSNMKPMYCFECGSELRNYTNPNHLQALPPGGRALICPKCGLKYLYVEKDNGGHEMGIWITRPSDMGPDK